MFDQFIPNERRARALEILGKMDRAVSAWGRGRVIQCIVLMVLLSVGWYFAGVPYWLLLGLVIGALNMVPYLAAVGWPIAVMLVWLDTLGKGQPFDGWHVFFWPSVVYLVGQNFDGWVVEPLVQGKATNLSPVAVLLAVLIGGSLAGVLGMLLAVPTAACGKILFNELLLPRWRARRRAT